MYPLCHSLFRTLFVENRYVICYIRISIFSAIIFLNASILRMFITFTFILSFSAVSLIRDGMLCLLHLVRKCSISSVSLHFVHLSVSVILYSCRYLFNLHLPSLSLVIGTSNFLVLLLYFIFLETFGSICLYILLVSILS